MKDKNEHKKEVKEKETEKAEETKKAEEVETDKEQEPKKAEEVETENEGKKVGGEKAEAVPDVTEGLKELAEDYKRKWYSVSAEYDNYRKRNQTAISKAYAEGVAEAVLKLLPVADNFGYAVSAATDEKTKAGIEKIIKNFNTILSSFGIEEVNVEVGSAFDESVAEAVMNSPCEEGETPNTVKTVLKKGYRSGDKIIRFAQVSVTV